jgi:hypothetical protein
MWGILTNTQKAAAKTGAAFAVFLAAGCGEAADAQTPMTAKVVSEKMSPDEYTAYVYGIVEGLAYARYIKDGKKSESRSCIRSWLRDKESFNKIDAAFRRYPDSTPADIIGTLIAVKCGV